MSEFLLAVGAAILWLAVAIVAFAVFAGFVVWFTWGLAEVGYMDYGLTFSQSCVVSAPVYGMWLLSNLMSRSNK